MGASVTKYDAQGFNPPAPIALITLREMVRRKQVSKVKMLLDTGADMTLLPRESVAKLGIAFDPERVERLIGFGDGVTLVPLVYLQIVFAGERFSGEYGVIDDECGIIGRDLLNRCLLCFDGPNLSWTRRDNLA